MHTFRYPLTIRLISWFLFVFLILGRETHIRFDEVRAIEPEYPESIKLIGGDLFTSLTRRYRDLWMSSSAFL